MANYTYISPQELVALLSDAKTQNQVAVIDCRDDDREQGFIAGSLHVPTATSSPSIYTELAKQLFDQKIMYAVFHCALSQVRGPKGAGRFAQAQQTAGYALPNVYVLRGGWDNFYAVYGASRQDLYYM